MFIVVYKAEGRRIYAPSCGIRRLFLDSNDDTQERWDSKRGAWYRQHIDLLACTWLMDGSQADLEQAQAWAAPNGWTAAVVPEDDEGHPLMWARNQAMESFWRGVSGMGAA